MSRGAAARFFQALGDGTRLELLERLRDGERTVGELVDALHCPQPKVSRHLKVLKEAGLVASRRDGRHVTYALTTRRRWSPEAREWLSRLDAGFPSAPRPGASASPRPAREVEGSSPRGEAPQKRDAPRPAPFPEGSRVRRPPLETHLL